MECYAKLGMWDDLAGEVLDVLGQDERRLWEENYREQYMEYFLRSQIMAWEGRTIQGTQSFIFHPYRIPLSPYLLFFHLSKIGQVDEGKP